MFIKVKASIIFYYFYFSFCFFKQMPTFNALFKIYRQKNITYSKSFLFFSEVLSM